MQTTKSIAAALTLTFASAIVWAQGPKLSPELKSAGGASNTEVIVQYKVKPGNAQTQKVVNLGGQVRYQGNNLQSVHYAVPASQLQNVANDPDVAYVSPNRPVQGQLNITSATVFSNVANTAGYKGTGIGVAVIDSGISAMPEFQQSGNRIVYQQSFVPQMADVSLGCPANAQVGAWYADTLDLQGGLAPYTVSISKGTLPAGLSFSSTTNNITGTPTTAANGVSVTYSVVDAWGNSATQSCSMNVAKAGGNGGGWANLNCGSTDGQAGSWFDSLPTFQNGVAPFKYSFAWGSLPAGLSLDTASGAITGVPAGGGWTDFVLQVQDSLGNGDRQYCHLNIANQPAIQYTPTDDPYGHGTHVAGILGSSGDGSVYIGMAPNVNLINLRVLDHNGHGTDATVIQAIDKAIELSKTYNIRVINLSLGREVFEPAAQDPLCQAVEAAWKAGIVVVAAAGNDGRDNSLGNKGYGTIAAPGNDPYVITVGAMKTMGTITRSDDLIASYSAKGPTAFDHFAKPDIVAPGNKIVSTMPTGTIISNLYPANRVDSEFFTLSGTSMATPVVSGAAVLLLSKYSSLTPDQVKALLMKNATKTFPASSTAVDPVSHASYTSYYDIFTVGAGYLNIAAALGDSVRPTGNAITPSSSFDSATGKVALTGLGASNVIWGTTGTFASNVIWGTNVAGANVIWGTVTPPTTGATSNVATSNVVWGTNIVWGTAVYGSNVVWGTSTPGLQDASIVGE